MGRGWCGHNVWPPSAAGSRQDCWKPPLESNERSMAGASWCALRHGTESNRRSRSQNCNGVKAMRAYPNIANEKPDATKNRETPQVKDPASNPPEPPQHEPSTCASLPDFKRLNYFYGQLLGVADFQTEQNFFREKLKLHNRCLHGYGVICGLKV